MDKAEFLTSDDLLGRCQHFRASVTHRQIKRWVSEGLLEPARLVGLGQGNGSETQWPAVNVIRATLVKHALNESGPPLSYAARVLLGAGYDPLKASVLRELLHIEVRHLSGVISGAEPKSFEALDQLVDGATDEALFQALGKGGQLLATVLYSAGQPTTGIGSFAAVTRASAIGEGAKLSPREWPRKRDIQEYEGRAHTLLLGALGSLLHRYGAPTGPEETHAVLEDSFMAVASH